MEERTHCSTYICKLAREASRAPRASEHEDALRLPGLPCDSALPTRFSRLLLYELTLLAFCFILARLRVFVLRGKPFPRSFAFVALLALARSASHFADAVQAISAAYEGDGVYDSLESAEVETAAYPGGSSEAAMEEGDFDIAAIQEDNALWARQADHIAPYAFEPHFSNWSRVLDQEEWLRVPHGNLIVGLRHEGCVGLNCITGASYSSVVDSSPMTCEYRSLFTPHSQKPKLAACSAGYVMSGIHQLSCNNLGCMVGAQCCKPVGSLGTQCVWRNVEGRFYDEGQTNCPANYFLSGLYKGACNDLSCMRMYSCCAFRVRRGEEESAQQLSAQQTAHCAAGEQPAGLDKCEKCPAGTYSDKPGAAACIACPLGTYAATAGSLACAPCPAGTYTGAPGQRVCEPISTRESFTSDPVNYITLNLASQSITPRYRYEPKTVDWAQSHNREGWLGVPDGGYITGFSRKLCQKLSCLTGATYSTPSLSALPECVVKSVSKNYRHTMKWECDSDYALVGIYRESCDNLDCIKRFKCCKPKNTAGSMHMPPQSGNVRFRKARGSKCPSNSYVQGLVRERCTDLNCVYEMSCIIFKVGRCDQKSVMADDGSCQACPSGHVPGKGNGNNSGQECKACPKGKRSYESENARTCVPCAKGWYSAESGQAECTRCPDGKTTVNDGAESAERCEACSAGKAIASKATHVADMPTLSCQTCRAGTYAPAGAPTCTACNTGSVAKEGSGSCTVCPRGKFALNNECVTCGPGQIAPTEGTSAVRTCPLGTGTDDHLTCSTCARGYAAKQGEHRGSSSDEPNIRYEYHYCEKCPAGKVKDKDGQGTCQDCPVGKFQKSSAQASCEPCPEGTYSLTRVYGNRRRDHCKPCAKGTTSAPGSSTCNRCTAGTHAVSTDTASFCRKCPKGKYGDTLGSTAQCKACPAGKVAPAEGMRACTACATGKTANNDQSDCSPICNAGHYLTSGGACSACPKGKYNAERGARSCHFCPVGTFSDKEGASSCEKCPGGSYAKYAGAKECAKCPKGTFRAAESSSQSCSPCATGKIAAAEGQASCQACPKRKYSAVEGASVCYSCPEGMWSTQQRAFCIGKKKHGCRKGTFVLNKKKCKSCGPGKYQDHRNAHSCKECPKGTYSDKVAQLSCTKCPAGKIGVKQGATRVAECVACDRGTYSSVEGRTTECDKCPPGTYRSSEGATSRSQCLQCPHGKFNPNAGSRACHVCRGGTVRSFGTQCVHTDGGR